MHLRGHAQRLRLVDAEVAPGQQVRDARQRAQEARQARKGVDSRRGRKRAQSGRGGVAHVRPAAGTELVHEGARLVQEAQFRLVQARGETGRRLRRPGLGGPRETAAVEAARRGQGQQMQGLALARLGLGHHARVAGAGHIPANQVQGMVDE